MSCINVSPLKVLVIKWIKFSNLDSHTLKIYLKRGPDCWFLFFGGLNFQRKMVQVFFCCLPEQIDFFNFTITKHECFKYLKSNEELPRTQEDQLCFLFNQFSFSDLETAFTIATTTYDKNAMKVYYPIPWWTPGIREALIRAITWWTPGIPNYTWW